jgi:hypothetical protein
MGVTAGGQRRKLRGAGIDRCCESAADFAELYTSVVSKYRMTQARHAERQSEPQEAKIQTISIPGRVGRAGRR